MAGIIGDMILTQSVDFCNPNHYSTDRIGQPRSQYSRTLPPNLSSIMVSRERSNSSSVEQPPSKKVKQSQQIKCLALVSLKHQREDGSSVGV